MDDASHGALERTQHMIAVAVLRPDQPIPTNERLRTRPRLCES